MNLPNLTDLEKWLRNEKLGKLMKEYLGADDPLIQRALEIEIRGVLDRIDMIQRLREGL